MTTLDEHFAQFTDSEIIEKGWDEIKALCGSEGRPKRWTMSVPVDFNRDSDILFGEILKRFEKRLEQ